MCIRDRCALLSWRPGEADPGSITDADAARLLLAESFSMIGAAFNTTAVGDQFVRQSSSRAATIRCNAYTYGRVALLGDAAHSTGGASGQGGGGAAGLTLTSASTAVLLEPALQPGIEQQAAGRISRLGQTKTAKVVRLIVKDTVEEKIMEWSARRVEDGTSRRGGAALKLNDFVQLGIV